ncbi:MAG TPA: hypothetical protein VH475_08255 [Tepidisphaeraceae bacterium]|jgi:hypothetical protein
MRNSTTPVKRPEKAVPRKPEAPEGIPAPSGLSAESVAWWERLVAEFNFGDESLLLLQQALMCLDRVREAQAIIAAEGVVVKDRFNQPKQHPATVVEAGAHAGLVRYFRALNLDIEPLHDGPGRPSGT